MVLQVEFLFSLLGMGFASGSQAALSSLRAKQFSCFVIFFVIFRFLLEPEQHEIFQCTCIFPFCSSWNGAKAEFQIEI